MNRLPRNIHLDAANGGGVVLNVRTGRWYALNPTAQLLCSHLRDHDFETAVRAVAAKHPAVAEDRIRRDARELLGRLADRNLVVVGTAPTRPEEVWPPVFATADGGRRYRMKARLGLIAALLLTRLPFRWTVRILSRLRSSDREAASAAETAGVLAAVDAVLVRYPGRNACFEQSVAAVLTSALVGRRVGWVLGVAEDPYRFHAWVESDGVPVLPAPDPEFADYRRVFSV